MLDLVTKQVTHGVLDDAVSYHREPVYCHITEVNGAQLQTNLFGKTYARSWIARIQGDHKANLVAWSGSDELMPVVQVRKHATRTDVYFTSDREVSPDGMG